MIRCIDLSGEKEFKGAMSLMCWRIVAMDAGWKILGSVRRVMRSVFEGGEGDVRGGSVVRSSDKGLRDRFFDTEDGEAAVRGGESDILVSMGAGDGRLLESAMAVYGMLGGGDRVNLAVDVGRYNNALGVAN